MAGKDTTGTYSTEDYTLGRGRLFLSVLNSAGLPTNWRDMGNVSGMTITVSEEELEHFTMRKGLKTRDKTVTLSKDMSMAFTLDTISDENKALFVSGEQADYTNPAIAGITEFQLVADGDIVKVLKWFDLKDSTGNRAYGVTGTDVILKTTNATPVSLVEGTDYELEAADGMFRFLDSTAVNTAITGTEGVTLELTANAAAVNHDEIRALTVSDEPYALRFISENPANNDERTYLDFHKVKILADGDLPAIGDDWVELPFSARVDANETASPDSPHLTIRTPKAA